MPKNQIDDGPNPFLPDSPYTDTSFRGPAPSVGQRKSYQGGSNAHGKREPRTRTDTTAGDGANSMSEQKSGWPARSPSSKT